ncbi:EtfA9: electron transfer flavoprotein, subunit alpha [Desulfosarcina variabilis str. Montpellier]|uniref:electron transfer flavoprotein subunit alpha/FixB family protein n=1 Tax=Desulfosarcina variabilis TaxID=2300 RepID=UPI003AFA100A
MKTLIIEVVDAKRIGELVTVARIFGDTPDILALGADQIPGTFGKAYFTGDTVPANLIDGAAKLIQQEGYELVLLSATTVGTEIAGPLSVRLGAPVLTEVIEASADKTVARPIYGGKAVATFSLSQTPAILTIRRKYFEPATAEGTTTAEALTSENAPVTLVSEKATEVKGIPLEDAEVIISGGRGLGAEENFTMIREIADLLKAGVGASRGAVDEGWADPSMQIGQTGNIVAPSVYFAVGISGASQHLAGIANAKCVVAVNKDEDANIFKRARFGIVEDYKKVIPTLIQALKEE